MHSYSDRERDEHTLVIVHREAFNLKSGNFSQVLGSYVPDDTKTMSTAFGYRIPAGNIVKVPPKPNTYHFNNYNEYVVYDTSLIRFVCVCLFFLSDCNLAIGQFV